MKVIVGLGNPGKKYDKTRHNIGFIFCDTFVKENLGTWKKKFSAEVCEINLFNEKILVVKPQTFMNNSGTSLIEIMKFYKLKPEDFLLIQDDLALEFSKIRIKSNSSAGGHNGVKDIIQKFQTSNVLRVKYGILNEYKKDTKEFVLNDFTKIELEKISEDYITIKKIIDKFIVNGTVSMSDIMS